MKMRGFLFGVVAVVGAAAVVGAVLPVDRVSGGLEGGLNDRTTVVDGVGMAEAGRAGVEQQALALRLAPAAGARPIAPQQCGDGQTAATTARRAGTPNETPIHHP